MINNIDDTSFKEFISLNKNKTVILDFYTNRCGFCKLEDLIFDSLDSQLNNKDFSLAKVNCDLSKNLVERFLIQALPTIIILKDDKLISKLPGLANEKKILNSLK